MEEVYTFADLQNWSAATAGIEPPPRLSVFGDPVEHSKSPQMHNAALEKCGIPARYTRLLIHPGELAPALQLLITSNFIGTNLTIPHKVAGRALMDEVDDYAQKIGAVNTVLVEGGRLIGFNTDGPGLVRAIRADFGVDVRNLRVMVLGAGGGAGRSIATQCGIENCERLVLVNRTPEKAQALAKDLAPYFKTTRLLGPTERLRAIPWDERLIKEQLQTTDLVINATSAGMKRSDPPLLSSAILLPHLMVYDTIYTAAHTQLMSAAIEAGARAANGLSMLLHQGALSFEIWFNRDAPVAEMRAALMNAVGAA